jgi:chlorite dismutase
MSAHPERPPASAAGDVTADLHERGANQQVSNRRLYGQLQAFGSCVDVKPLVRALEAGRVPAALYQDVNDPRGVGVLALNEDPLFFATGLRELLNAEPFLSLEHKPAFTMFGRTYSSGFEPELEDWLLHRPRRIALNPAWPWAIWYPLRRTGAFARLSPQEQGSIIREHSMLGRAYGDADLAHDIRLACHGLGIHDNDFVIGLVGRQLHPLSHLVQSMRKTVQTAAYIHSMGPFFVGHVIWQSPLR